MNSAAVEDDHVATHEDEQDVLPLAILLDGHRELRVVHQGNNETVGVGGMHMVCVDQISGVY